MPEPRTGPFEGVRVVEFAHVIAGPLAGGLLADLGADVVHVEPPEVGDAARKMGPRRNGSYLWWKVCGRNKRSLTLDLRTERGQAVAHQLVMEADIVIASLRSHTLRRWNLDWPTLHSLHPKLIMLQVSGLGAKSSRADAPGFGKVGEARSGVVNLTGFPDGPPIHAGFSHGDSVTGLMGAFACASALFKKASDEKFEGEWIDLALFEGLFRLIEWQVIVQDQLGIAPERSGNRLPIAPAAVVNTYASKDGQWITVTSATPRSVLNVVRLLGLPEQEYATVEAQVEKRDVLDQRMRAWIAERTAEECLLILTEAEVVASRIFSSADIIDDPIYNELGDILSLEDRDLGTVRMQGVIPRLTNHPGRVWRTGPRLGEDNADVLHRWLGADAETMRSLTADGTLGEPPAAAPEPTEAGEGDPRPERLA